MDGSVSLLSSVSGELLYGRRVHQKYVVSLAWAADARTFVSASWDNSFAVHRTQPTDSASDGATGSMRRSAADWGGVCLCAADPAVCTMF